MISDIVLSYQAFNSYNEQQKSELQSLLKKTSLQSQQFDLLFSDDAAGGIIHNLVEDSKAGDETAAKQLGKILANKPESRNPPWEAPTPIIQNMLDKIGPYDAGIVADVITLVRNHIAICGGKIIEPEPDKQQPTETNAPPHGHRLFFFTINPGVVTTEQEPRVVLQDFHVPGVNSIPVNALPPEFLETIVNQFLNPASFSSEDSSDEEEFVSPPQAELDSQELKSINRSINANPDDLNARMRRTQLLGYYNPDVLYDYNYILDKTPYNIPARLARAHWFMVQCNLGDGTYDTSHEFFAKAQEDYRFILEKDPDNETAKENMAKLDAAIESPSKRFRAI